MEMTALTETRTQIYRFKNKTYENMLRKMREWQVGEYNREAFEEFLQSQIGKGNEKETIGKTMPELRNIFTALQKNVDCLTYKDILQIVAWIQSQNLADPTKSDYKGTLKQFLRWFKKIDDRLNSNNIEVRNEAIKLYNTVEEIKTKYKPKPIDPSELMNDEDFKIIMSFAKNPMIEAILAILYFCGFRIRELLGIRIKNVHITNLYGEIWVTGKNKTYRKVTIVEALPYLQNWLKHHPDADNPEALVWISKDARNYGKPLSYAGICRAIERACERAGYLRRAEATPEQKARKEKPRIIWRKKRFNPHSWRKACATNLACDLTEGHLNEMMGWVQGSKQSGIYVHLNGSQTRDAYLASRGMLERKSAEPPNIKCECGTLNPKINKFCNKCNKPLSSVAIMLDEKQREEAITEAMNKWLEIMNNPELREKFEDFQRQTKYRAVNTSSE